MNYVKKLTVATIIVEKMDWKDKNTSNCMFLTKDLRLIYS